MKELKVKTDINGMRYTIYEEVERKQKPLSDKEIEKEHDEHGRDQSNVGFKSFIDGVRFAEKKHGIS